MILMLKDRKYEYEWSRRGSDDSLGVLTAFYCIRGAPPQAQLLIGWRLLGVMTASPRTDLSTHSADDPQEKLRIAYERCVRTLIGTSAKSIHMPSRIEKDQVKKNQHGHMSTCQAKRAAVAPGTVLLAQAGAAASPSWPSATPDGGPMIGANAAKVLSDPNLEGERRQSPP
jgi:hypothetical protein